MPTPGEYKTVQARILAYAQEVGWTIVPREEAERRRGFEPSLPSWLRRSGPDAPPADRARNRSLFFDDVLDAKVREFNPCYAEAEGALLGQFRHLHTDLYCNQGRPINQAAHIAMNCDKATQSLITRYLLRLD